VMATGARRPERGLGPCVHRQRRQRADRPQLRGLLNPATRC
jgi:hypothetical protein